MARLLGVIVATILGFFVVSSMLVFVAPYLAALIVMITAVSVLVKMFESHKE